MKNQRSGVLSPYTRNRSDFYLHQPVLVEEAVSLLDCRRGKVIVDGTCGSGGHSLEILKNIMPDGYLIGIDLDEEAIERTEKRLMPFKTHFSLYRENYRDLSHILSKGNMKSIDGFFLDLGLSSEQIQDPGRGFSFRREGPLDMRYDRRLKEMAWDVVNRESKERLARIFRDFGEERKAHRIADFIVKKREEKPIETTLELARIAARAKAFSARENINPATRIFQALRIHINKELENLNIALMTAIRLVSKGGRVCVISYHSLEDRIVKNFFKKHAASGEISIITRRPVVPSKKEIAENRRSRSAKLRCAEILRA